MESVTTTPAEEAGSHYNIRFLEKSEYPLWDWLLSVSPQATIFSTPVFCDAYAAGSGITYKILGIFKGTQIRGGFLFFEKEENGKTIIPTLLSYVPYQTLHWEMDRNKTQLKGSLEMIHVVEQVSNFLAARYEKLGFALHHSLIDVRPYQWYRYHEGGFYTIAVRYTSLLKMDSEAEMWDRMHSHRRGDIRRAQKNKISIEQKDDFDAFSKLYVATFDRQGIQVASDELAIIRSLYAAMSASGQAKLYFAKTPESVPISATLLMGYRDELYYCFGASDPEYRNSGAGSYALWNALVENVGTYKVFDVVGINSPNRGWFKLSFGGSIVPYYMASHQP